ncbi:hypothetical protein [Enterococcus dongliensis]|uniref:hypothetical protein n=1 Tax=Enterococcus dongliensis TaxID=2559925 RepID=UPI0028911ED0|nr:hypothetical protein [Enterococcus dongliensis]MDT2614646.1 hypothetical protein [Enterococcus dongliensis]
MRKRFKLIKNNNIQSFGFGLLGGFVAFILWGINYTLSGSLAEWIGALGTAGAVWVSLWLVFREEEFDVQIVVQDRRKRIHDGKETIALNQSEIVAQVYNAGVKPLGITFLGFWSYKLSEKPNEEGYVRTLFEEINGTELEFVQPGYVGKEYLLDSDLTKIVSKKYSENDGTLRIEAIFVDIKGKKHTRTIIIPEGWE